MNRIQGTEIGSRGTTIDYTTIIYNRSDEGTMQSQQGDSICTQEVPINMRSTLRAELHQVRREHICCLQFNVLSKTRPTNLVEFTKGKTASPTRSVGSKWTEYFWQKCIKHDFKEESVKPCVVLHKNNLFKTSYNCLSITLMREEKQ